MGVSGCFAAYSYLMCTKNVSAAFSEYNLYYANRVPTSAM